MDYTSQSRHFIGGVYPCFNTEVEHKFSPIQISPAVKNNFSEKAKAFTIDALLKKDDKEKKPGKTELLSSQNKMVGCQMKCVEKSALQNLQTNDSSSNSENVISYEEFSKGLKMRNLKSSPKCNSYLPLKTDERTRNPSQIHFNYLPAAEIPHFSPLMTSGFFRPMECYSPMSSEGQNTPVGLKTTNRTPVSVEKLFNAIDYSGMSTPNSKNSSVTPERYFTPTEKHNPYGSESRKMLSKRHDRPHPYLSSRHSFITDKSDTCMPHTEEVKCQVTIVTDKDAVSGNKGKGKRHRTAFTSEQLQCLETEFEKQQYLVGQDRCELAKSLKLTVLQVKVWFQNRRIKLRKEQFGLEH